MTHVPVLLDEVKNHLNLRSNNNAVDCTLGDGGHSKLLLKQTAPKGKLLAIDADKNSLQRARERLSNFDQKRIAFVNDNFRNLKSIVKELSINNIQSVLFDLGWSTSQLEDEKGFSFQSKESLDMRYEEEGKTASDIINGFSEEKLAFIFRRYGEEKFSEDIAQKIARNREKEKIETTKQLVNIILEVYRGKLNSEKKVPWAGGVHPATQVFQALRIAVNKELDSLRKVLPQAVEVLTSGGRVAVISFHSLEDRIVKHFFKGQKDKLDIVTNSPITPTKKEIGKNPKSRSAKLRIAEKL